MLALDHIVLAGENIEKASTKYGHEFAVKAVKGGEHHDWGTYNYLAYFSNDSYIEWLGVQEFEKAKHSDNSLIKHLVFTLDNNHAGPFQFALRTDKTDSYIEHFNANNIPYKGPFYGKRKRPDGSLLEWRMLFPEYDHEKEMLPFLIEWNTEISGPSVNSLANPQTIMYIYYGGVDQKKFEHIYKLKPKRLAKNQFALQNSKLILHDNNNLRFELV